MSEERKPEESLISDENLFKEYFAALLTRQLGVEDSRRIAEDAIAEHRKLFPKKIKGSIKPESLPSDGSNLISITEASKMLGVSIPTMRAWDKNGRLKSVRHGENQRRFYLLSAIEALISTMGK